VQRDLRPWHEAVRDRHHRPVSTGNGEGRDVVVQSRGDVSSAERAYARDKIASVRRFAPGVVLFARVDLTAHSDPARERPAFAKAELDIDGRLVRAHVAATTMFEAVDRLEARLRDRVERYAHHQEAVHLRHRAPALHEWRHGDPPSSRPSYFPRPVAERELVRHKTFAVGATTPEEAVLDLELLDHDFHLFTNVETCEDNVVARSEDGGYELFEPSATCTLRDAAASIRRSAVRPPTMGLDGARALLDVGDAPFVFFVEPESGRGRVLYRRYDGHYGLIVPSDEP
jgi:ribosome-associated translation inhibitor RaiA